MVLAEALIWFLALAGPGSRYSIRRTGDHGLIARWFVDEPSFWDAVLINAAVIHVFIAGAFLAARIVSRRRKEKGSYRNVSNGADA